MRPSALLAALLLALPHALAAQESEESDSALSVVSGIVVDHASGAPVADAAVVLTPRGAVAAGGVGAARRLSADDGTFRFDGVAAGDYAFSVEALGYAPTADVIEVAAQSDVAVEVRLTASAIALQPIVVETSRRPAFMDGFEERRANARTHTGFFTADEIIALHPKHIAEVFLSVPGARLVMGRIGGDELTVDGNMARPRNCAPNVFVNGIYMGAGSSYNELYLPEHIAAVELYALDHNVPQRFQAPEPCGALVIWLKQGVDAPRFAATWKRLLGAVAAVTALLLLAR